MVCNKDMGYSGSSGQPSLAWASPKKLLNIARHRCVCLAYVRKNSSLEKIGQAMVREVTV